MNKNQKIIVYGGAGVLACLVALIIVLIVTNSSRTNQVNEARAQADSLLLANDRLLLTNEFNQLNADFSQYEDQQVYLKNDSLVQKYNEARLKVEGLLQELSAEKRSNEANRKRIKQLEGEIATLKGIVKHYLEEIKRLGEENTKARQLGVSFIVSPNNTAAPGMKDFHIRILSPEGSLLGGGGSFQLDGSSVTSTAHRQVEYANGEISVSVYWDVNTTLTPGDYTVEVFCDGYRLASRHFTMKK